MGDGVSIDRSDDTANEFSGLVSVMGDFNLWPDDPIMKKMPKKLTDSADHVDMPGSREKKIGKFNGTHHPDQGGRIDAIWIDPGFYEVLARYLMDKTH